MRSRHDGSYKPKHARTNAPEACAGICPFSPFQEVWASTPSWNKDAHQWQRDWPGRNFGFGNAREAWFRSLALAMFHTATTRSSGWSIPCLEAAGEAGEWPGTAGPCLKSSRAEAPSSSGSVQRTACLARRCSPEIRQAACRQASVALRRPRSLRADGAASSPYKKSWETAVEKLQTNR